MIWIASSFWFAAGVFGCRVIHVARAGDDQLAWLLSAAMFTLLGVAVILTGSTT